MPHQAYGCSPILLDRVSSVKFSVQFKTLSFQQTSLLNCVNYGAKPVLLNTVIEFLQNYWRRSSNNFLRCVFTIDKSNRILRQLLTKKIKQKEFKRREIRHAQLASKNFSSFEFFLFYFFTVLTGSLFYCFNHSNSRLSI